MVNFPIILPTMRQRQQISNSLGITEQYLSMLLKGRRKISWILAERLSQLFPGKSISQWKRVQPEELKKVFAQLSEYSDLKKKETV